LYRFVTLCAKCETNDGESGESGAPLKSA